jgi:hypothetical protein
MKVRRRNQNEKEKSKEGEKGEEASEYSVQPFHSKL